ncbi:hypothetical protein Tco_1499451 [Tanacetum coccineum]
MDDPNITMEEYIRFEEEKARRRGQMFNWQTATFGKVENYEDEDVCSIDSETEYTTIVFNNAAIPFEPTAYSPDENKIDFRISLDESDDEDYTVIFDENSFSYKIIYVNDLKTDSGNDEPLSSNHMANDLDCFKDFKNEFPAIVYNDGLTSKSDFETLINSECIDLIDETSLSEYDNEVDYYANEMLFFLIINLYMSFGIPFDPKQYYKDGSHINVVEAKIWHHYQLLIRGTHDSAYGRKWPDLSAIR